MLVHVLCVLLAGVPVCLAAAYPDYYDIDALNDDPEFYSNDNEGIQPSTVMTTAMDAVTLVKKRELGDMRTLHPVENFDVKGALYNILRKTTPESSQELQAVVRENSNSYDYIENSNAIQKEDPVNRDGSNGNILYKKKLPSLRVQNWSPSDGTQANVADYSSQTDQRWINVYQTGASTYLHKNDIIDQIRKIAPVFDENVAEEQPVYPSYDIQTLHPTVVIQTLTTTDGSDTTQYNTMVYQQTLTDINSEVNNLVPHWNLSSIAHRRILPNNVQHWSTTNDVPLWNLSDNILHRKPPGQAQHWGAANYVPLWNLSDNILHRKPPGQAQHGGPAIDVHNHRPPSNVEHHTPPSSVQHGSSFDVLPPSPVGMMEHWNYADADYLKNLGQALRNADNATDSTVSDIDSDIDADPTTTETTSTVTTTMQSTTTLVRLDISAIVDIVRNLSDRYIWNISDYFSKALLKAGYSTCYPLTKKTTEAVTINKSTEYDFENTSVVSKCFVCGLKTPEIPRHAYCADAFAGDFLPLMPIDPRSRGRIASFRKYCRHIDAHNYVENPSEPRAIYGRFTGGCAVRWTDVTGVYTQRTCRSKYRPLMGQHFASKRMAKMELALMNEEDSCIISPMASLLPVSRGISLYARFHVCVCSTNWCNKTARTHSSLYSTIVFVLACWLAHYT